MSEAVEFQTGQVREEQEEPAAAGGKAARGQGEAPDVRRGLDGRAGRLGAFFFQAPAQGDEFFGLKNFPDGGFLALEARSFLGGHEERRGGITPEVLSEHAERVGRIAERGRPARRRDPRRTRRAGSLKCATWASAAPERSTGIALCLLVLR